MTQVDTTCCCPPEGETGALLVSEDFTGEKLNDTENLTYYSSTPDAYGRTNPIYTTIEGKTCGHYYAQQGTNEQTPFLISVEKDDAKRIVGADTFGEFCIEWQEYFKGGYPFTHGQKMFRVGYEGVPASKKSFELALLDDGHNLQASCFIGMWGNDTHGSIEWFENTGKDHPVDKWVTWRAWVKLNSPGQSNGFVKLTKDGAPFITGENLNLRGTDTLGWNWTWIGGNYSTEGGATTLPNDGHRYITGIRWWTTNPD